MSKITVVPFRLDHIDLLELRDHETSIFGTGEDLKRGIAGLLNSEASGSLMCDGRLIAIMGYVTLWPGLVEVYVLPSKHLPQYGMAFARFAKRYIKIIKRLERIKRMQTHSLNDDLHNRWMSFLGFKNETPEGMRSYSVNGDMYNLWSMVF